MKIDFDFTQRRLIDVWGQGVYASLYDLPGAVGTREMYRHFSMVEFGVNVSWFSHLTYEQITHTNVRTVLDEQGARFLHDLPAGTTALVREAKRLGLEVLITLDGHVNQAPPLYHSRPPNDVHYVPFSRPGRVGKILEVMIDVLEPDVVEFLNEPYYARDWEGIGADRYSFLCSHLVGVTRSKGIPMLTSGPLHDRKNWQGEHQTEIMGWHWGVFPPTADPAELYKRTRWLAEMNSAVARKQGKVAWNDEGAGVGKRARTDTERGAALTEAYISGNFDGGMNAVGILVVGGVSPIHNPAWGVTMGLVRKDGTITPAGERVIEMSEKYKIKAPIRPVVEPRDPLEGIKLHLENLEEALGETIGTSREDLRSLLRMHRNGTFSESILRAIIRDFRGLKGDVKETIQEIRKEIR